MSSRRIALGRFGVRRRTCWSRLGNRVLAPVCDAIGEPRVSWHSFRHYLTFLTMSSPAMPAPFYR
jgi:hypothetical protein